MTDVRKLLAEATPLPWKQGERHAEVIRTRDWLHAQSSEGDAALIVYAVNHLPDYLAAVQTAQNLVSFCDIEVPYWADIPGQQARWHEYSILLASARAALRRLRAEVPA